MIVSPMTLIRAEENSIHGEYKELCQKWSKENSDNKIASKIERKSLIVKSGKNQ